jgi:hypothetical protein
MVTQEMKPDEAHDCVLFATKPEYLRNCIFHAVARAAVMWMQWYLGTRRPTVIRFEF